MVLSQAAQMKMDENMKKMEEKIQQARLLWFERNYEKVYKDPFRPSYLTPKKAEELYNRIMDVRKEQFQREQDMRREEEENEEETKRKLLAMMESRGTRFEQEKDIMFPVPDDVRQILYNGVSKCGEGRFLYLKTRNQLAPYEKFRRRVTETQGYGWRIEERAERPCKDFNRLSVIKDSFYRRYGAVKPDSLRKNPPFTKAQVTVEVL